MRRREALLEVHVQIASRSLAAVLSRSGLVRPTSRKTRSNWSELHQQHGQQRRADQRPVPFVQGDRGRARPWVAAAIALSPIRSPRKSTAKVAKPEP